MRMHCLKCLYVLLVTAGIAPCANAPADSKPPQQAVVESERVSVGSGDFWLRLAKQNELLLHHTEKGRESIWAITPMGLREGLAGDASYWNEIAANRRIDDIALSRFGRHGLIAVVTVRGRDKAEFWSLTFPQMGSPHKEKSFSPYAVRLAEGDSEDEVLALSATRRGTIVTLVTVKRVKERPWLIETGTIVFDGCPFPAPAAGTTAKFTVEHDASAVSKD